MRRCLPLARTKGVLNVARGGTGDAVSHARRQSEEGKGRRRPGPGGEGEGGRAGRRTARAARLPGQA